MRTHRVRRVSETLNLFRSEPSQWRASFIAISAHVFDTPEDDGAGVWELPGCVEDEGSGL